ncbi:MAG: magnesium transporter CorA family protein [Bacteroidales bacterium]|nr:magnesium transporter CorA family protein [Bacteroidales bacterium]
MIRVVHWSHVGHTACREGLEDLPQLRNDLQAGDVVWVDLETPNEDEEHLVFEQLIRVHPLTLEDMTKPRREPVEGAHFPKVEEFPDYLFVIVNPLPELFTRTRGVPVENGDTPTAPRFRTTAANRPQLSAILSERLLVTHHYHRLACIEVVQNYVDRHGNIGQRGPDYLFHLVLDTMVDEYAAVVEGMAGQMEALETRILLRNAPDIMPKLLRTKRQLNFLRKTLVLERELLARLTRGDFRLVQEQEVVYYRNVYDHLVRYTELVESGRDMVSDLMHTQLAASSNRLNEIMKLLTMISTIVLPMTLIAGIYGMNFEHTAVFKWEWGFAYSLLLMLTTGIAALGLFWWKRWI